MVIPAFSLGHAIYILKGQNLRGSNVHTLSNSGKCPDIQVQKYQNVTLRVYGIQSEICLDNKPPTLFCQSSLSNLAIDLLPVSLSNSASLESESVEEKKVCVSTIVPCIVTINYL